MLTLTFNDIGNTRWQCHVEIDKRHTAEFFGWVRENIPGCHVSYHSRAVVHKPHYPPVTLETYVIRGGNVSDASMLAIRWNGEQS